MARSAEASAPTDGEGTRREPPSAVGLVGLGLMGSGIARNLDRAGLLAAACDSAAGAFDKAGLSERVGERTPAAMAEHCDVLVFAVPSSRQIADCLECESGLLAARRPGAIILDLTTSDPEATRALAARAEAAGWGYVDAAMTGGAAGADAGTLSLMIGGDADPVARCRPIFAAIGSKAFHLGPTGSGQAMKLVHNMILHTIFLATCEGCRVAERAGIDLAAAIEVLNAGNACSFVSEVRFPRHILSGTFDARSYVSTLAKDLGMAVEFAERLERPTPFGALTSAMLQAACAEGLGAEDFSRLYQQFDRIAGLIGEDRR